MARLLSLLPLLFFSLQSTHALWPQPRKLQTGTSALRLAPNTTFKITVDVANAPADLFAAVQRTRAHLFTDKLARLVPSHGAEDLPALSHAKALPGLTLRLLAQEGATGEGSGVVAREIATEARTYILDRQEDYVLNVPDDGTEAVLGAASTLGLFRGLNTFAQLWYAYDHGKEALNLDGKNRECDGVVMVVYTLSAPVAIQDSPAYVNPFRIFYSLGMLTMGVDTVAISWVHAGHGAEFVSDQLLPLFDRLLQKLMITTSILASQCLTLSARSMRCPGFMCVSIYPLSRDVCDLTASNDCAA
jgi:hexosaminidase